MLYNSSYDYFSIKILNYLTNLASSPNMENRTILIVDTILGGILEMHKGMLTFTKLSIQLYSPDDCRNIEEHHEITFKGESEEDLLQFHADYIDYHMNDLPTNSKFKTIGVEIINQSFIIL